MKYDKEFNKNLSRKVYNFNRTIIRAAKAGVPRNRLPETIKVSELKGSFNSKKEIERVLNQLSKFSRKSTSERIAIDSDYKTTKWNYDFVRMNAQNAKEYFEKEYKRVEKRVGKFAGERDYLNTISAKINVLEKNVKDLDGREFRASLSAINEFIAAPSLQNSRYRGFLSEVEAVMDTLNINESDKNAFFKKFKQLTPTQFLYAYDNNDIIARVYALYFKRDEEGNVKINTTSQSAKKILKSLFEQADAIVEDAKANSV